MIVSGQRWFRRDVLAALGWGAAAVAASSAFAQSANPNDYVQVHDGRFVLGGRPYVARGTNYFGSWHYNYTLKNADGTEQGNIWAFYHDWDTHKLALDFQFMASQLNATAVRIGTPSLLNFDNLVKFHGYEPWFNPDGTIADRYRDELIQLADLAYANGMRIQLCLLWFLHQEIVKDGDAFVVGGRLDRFYANHIRSVAHALSNHPGVMSISIGNEVLIDWQTNGTHPSWYEPRAAGFILRRLNDLRAAAPLQLLTTDEVAAPGSRTWHDPGPEFAVLPDVDNSNGGKPFRLADKVDYLAPHFYPATLTPADLNGTFARKIEDAKHKLTLYMQAANSIRKPVMMGEFGLKIAPQTLPPEQYAPARDTLFQQYLAEGQRSGLQGLLAWGALPEMVMQQGHYHVDESRANRYSPTEVDMDDTGSGSRRILFYDPSFALFVWSGDSSAPTPTAAAQALASAWSGVPRPPRH